MPVAATIDSARTLAAREAGAGIAEGLQCAGVLRVAEQREHVPEGSAARTRFDEPCCLCGTSRSPRGGSDAGAPIGLRCMLGNSIGERTQPASSAIRSKPWLPTVPVSHPRAASAPTPAPIRTSRTIPSQALSPTRRPKGWSEGGLRADVPDRSCAIASRHGEDVMSAGNDRLRGVRARPLQSAGRLAKTRSGTGSVIET